MKENLTELVFVLDRSGSMSGLESDTIGGFNSMLTKQQEEPGACRITTILFDGQYEILHDRIDLQAVRPITSEEYYVRGNTALLDAVGKTIEKIGKAQKHTAAEYRADKVMFVIITDGMENASTVYSYPKIHSMIQHQKAKHGWEFIFLGANIDTAEVAARIGVDRNRAQSFHNDRKGVALYFSAVSEAALSLRNPSGGMIMDDWNAEIQEDFEKRGGKSEEPETRN